MTPPDLTRLGAEINSRWRQARAALHERRATVAKGLHAGRSGTIRRVALRPDAVIVATLRLDRAEGEAGNRPPVRVMLPVSELRLDPERAHG